MLADHLGNPVRGVASNYLCDRQVADTVVVTGPFGSSFLMPNHPRSHIVMICTGTGSAPMRAMTEWRASACAASGKFESGKLCCSLARAPSRSCRIGSSGAAVILFDVNLGVLPTPGEPKRYVQDVMRARGGPGDHAGLSNAYFYVCGLKSMEQGVVPGTARRGSMRDCRGRTVAAALRREGRLHLETY